MQNSRRKFLIQAGTFTLTAGVLGWSSCNQKGALGSTGNNVEIPNMFFKISLAQWSLNKTLFSKKLDNLDFAAKARKDFGLDAVEYVNQFFKDKAKDMEYLKSMKQRADDNGVKSLLIMIDGEGGLGDPNSNERKKAVENHYKWVDAAKFLGCHSIRVNAFGQGTAEEVSKAAIDGLGSLSDYASKVGLNVIVENHGSYSSDGQWLTKVMQQINKPNCGTLPDFGNFCVKRDSGTEWGGKCVEEYDRYKGVTEMMAFAKAVSAKAHDFDVNGNETHTDYVKMMKIVKDAGYKGYVGIEYEGSGLTEEQGILATRDLLIKAGKSLS
jgi:sugar phosphate isomerase/epimerase